MVGWLVPGSSLLGGSSPGRVIMLCSWEKHGTSLNPCVQLDKGELNVGECYPVMDQFPIQTD